MNRALTVAFRQRMSRPYVEHRTLVPAALENLVKGRADCWRTANELTSSCVFLLALDQISSKELATIPQPGNPVSSPRRTDSWMR